jgi:hypothetical protein
MKIVYTIVDRSPGKSFWTRVGVGFVNRDGSINLRLDAIPISGTLNVRDWEERDGMRPQGTGAGSGAGQSPSSMARPRSGPEVANAPHGQNGARGPRGSADEAGGLA